MQWDDIPPVVNYLKCFAPGHPLANSRGIVALHRWVLYQRIGAGPHPCHWCGVILQWNQGRHLAGAVIVDHIDGNRGNNAPANLVPSCNPCNTRRAHPGNIAEGEPVVLLAGGRSRAGRITCEYCGELALIRRHRLGEQRACSRGCATALRHRETGWAVKDDELFLEIDRRGERVRIRAGHVTCERCGDEFFAELIRIKRGSVRFCSHSCSGKANGAHTANRRRGSAHPHTKLTEDDIREIRRIWAAGGITLVALGARFGLSKSGTNMIVNRRCWKHVS